MAALISVQNLTKSFGNIQAVQGVSFTVNKGEVLGFLGCNGAGKTTTMRMLSGYLPADSGTMMVCGKLVGVHHPDVRKHIGYLAEGGPLYLDMKTQDLLLFVAKILQLQGGYQKERIEYVTEALRLTSILRQTIGTLSKGYRRRVALALTLLHDPEVLILDEPTDGLDPNQKWEVQELIRSIANDKAIILSTHILDEAEILCKRALIIDAGKVISSGTLSEIMGRAPHATNLTQAFRIITQHAAQEDA